MNKFLEDHGLSKTISEKLKSHGVTDETFLCLSDECIAKIFNEDAASLTKFLPLYTLEKYKLCAKNPVVQVLDTLEVDQINADSMQDINVPSQAGSSACDASTADADASNLLFDDLHIDYTSDIFGDNNEKVKREKNFELYFPEIEDGVELTKNRLYFELQDSVLGRIIIGKYRNSKILDLDKLKNFCVLRRLKEEINYKITTEEFLEDVALIKELFPPLDTDLLYRPYRQSATGISLAIQGPLYSRYRYFLEEGRKAGLISLLPDRSRKRPHVAGADDEESPSKRFKILTDTNRESYEFNDVIEKWNNTLDDRITEFLTPSAAKKVKPQDRVTAYINTFKCLRKTDEIFLLKSDFKRIITVLAEKVKLPYSIESVNTLFQTVWPEKAKIIVKNLSKNKDVTACLRENKGILNEVDPSIQVLFLLPLTLTGYAKKVKRTDPNSGNDETVVLSKQDISKHFILRIEDPNNFAREKTEFENWQRRYNVNTHPYVIFVGPLTNISAGYVIFNGHTYMYENPLEAVEVCFQLYTALHYWPDFVDHVWQFITECVYEIKTQTDFTVAFVRKSYLPISTYACKIKSK